MTDLNRPICVLAHTVTAESDGTFTAAVHFSGFRDRELAAKTAFELFRIIEAELTDKIGPGLREQ